MPISFEGQIYTHTVILQTKKECKVSAWQRWDCGDGRCFALLNFIYRDLFAVGSDVKQHIDGRFNAFFHRSLSQRPPERTGRQRASAFAPLKLASVGHRRAIFFWLEPKETKAQGLDLMSDKFVKALMAAAQARQNGREDALP